MLRYIDVSQLAIFDTLTSALANGLDELDRSLLTYACQYVRQSAIALSACRSHAGGTGSA